MVPAAESQIPLPAVPFPFGSQLYDAPERALTAAPSTLTMEVTRMNCFLRARVELLDNSFFLARRRPRGESFLLMDEFGRVRMIFTGIR